VRKKGMRGSLLSREGGWGEGLGGMCGSPLLSRDKTKRGSGGGGAERESGKRKRRVEARNRGNM